MDFHNLYDCGIWHRFLSEIVDPDLFQCEYEDRIPLVFSGVTSVKQLVTLGSETSIELITPAISERCCEKVSAVDSLVIVWCSANVQQGFCYRGLMKILCDTGRANLSFSKTRRTPGAYKTLDTAAHRYADFIILANFLIMQ